MLSKNDIKTMLKGIEQNIQIHEYPKDELMNHLERYFHYLDKGNAPQAAFYADVCRLDIEYLNDFFAFGKTVADGKQTIRDNAGRKEEKSFLESLKQNRVAQLMKRGEEEL